MPSPPVTSAVAQAATAQGRAGPPWFDAIMGPITAAPVRGVWEQMMRLHMAAGTEWAALLALNTEARN
jgi:hypothetical protein